MSDPSFQGTYSIWFNGEDFPFREPLPGYEVKTPEYSEVDLEDYLRTGLIKEGERER